MKHSLLAILLFISTLSNAQTWQGIKIGSSYDVVKSQLIQKGYKYVTNSGNGYFFTSNKSENKQIFVYVHPSTKVVYHLNVDIISSDNWTTLNSKYDEISEILSEKYNKVDYQMSFEYPFEDAKTNYEIMTAIKTGHAMIYRSYRDENGKSIILSISHITSETSVKISYIDNDLYDNVKEIEKNELKNQY